MINHTKDIWDFAAQHQCQELHSFFDKETDLRGVISIHNTARGPALGGCRFIEYPSSYPAMIDAIRLGRGMTLKSAISDLPLGGGKAVLMKPKKIVSRKKIFEAFGRFLQSLGGRYITAVDSGTSSNDMDYISEHSAFVANTTKSNYSLSDPSSVTALGVYYGIKASVAHKLKLSTLEGLKIGVLGVGSVGYHLIKLLAADKAKIVVCDIDTDKVTKCQEEFNLEVRPSLGAMLKESWDIFAPCALGGVLNEQSIALLDTKIIAGAANNQLENTQRDSKALYEKGILYAPDYVVSAGGIIYVAGEYQKIAENETLAKVEGIGVTLSEIFERADMQHCSPHSVAEEMALEKVQESI